MRQVHLFGGCVTSWKQASGDEVLYVRPDAKFDGSKPISGGIPHCFPQVRDTRPDNHQDPQPARHGAGTALCSRPLSLLNITFATCRLNTQASPREQ